MQSSRRLPWQRGSSRLRGRVVALNMVLALMAVLVPTALIPAGAADDPVHVNFTLEGCRNDGSITFPDDGPFICPDSAYTTGNLGKGWAELDLVPHRVTLRNDGGTQTYSFVIAGDYKNGSATGTGWDVISELLTLNVSSSVGVCPTTLAGDDTITAPGDGVGGALQTIYQTVTLTQLANTTCVYDYYQRLALGAHNFSGASLQSNLWNQYLTSSGIGQKRLSIPVAEIEPQELSKNMSASQGSDYVWNLTKSTDPDSVSFADTCLDSPAARSRLVRITVSWDRLEAAPNGGVTVITNITVTNPASRTVTVSVSDQLYTGTQAIGEPVAFATDVDIRARSSETFTKTIVLPAGTVLVNNSLRDVATATYTDMVTGVIVPGNTTATATAPVVTLAATSNQTAVITDDESITGSGFTYSVATPAIGRFVAPYVAGTRTTSQSWTSGVQTGDGSVTFVKTVYATAGLAGEGILSDTATLLASGGFTTSAHEDVALSAAALVNLTINKTIPDVLDGDETASFDFDVLDAGGLVVDSATITFDAGDIRGSALVSGLAPGTYTVREIADASGQWAPQDSKTVTITLPRCAGSVAFNNTPNPLGISLDKQVNGGDHATADDALLVHAGDVLTYDVVITNTGLVPLTITSLADTLRDPDFDGTCTQGIGSILAPGDSFTCTYPMTALRDATNEASVIGIDGLGRDVTARDRTFVDVINPAIQVVKTVDDESPTVGQTVTYTYVVTNTGDTTLSPVTVVDDVLGDIGTIATLAPGASSTLTMDVVITKDTPSVNVALATGKDILGKKVTDDDDATIAVTTVLGIVVVKPAVQPVVQPAVLPAVLAQLPRTGMAVGGILLLGFGLLLGGLALRSTRRRQQPSA